jgi:thiol-disulfide isomerase/thioredoxin
MNRRQILVGATGLVAAAAGAALVPRLFRNHPLEGELAPDFTLPMVGHESRERVRLSDQRGKVVVLDFWASWCEPCRHGIPLFNSAVKKFGDKLIMLGINSEQHDDHVIALIMTQWGFKYSTLRDQALEAQLAYQVQVFPTVVLVDPEGIVRRVYPGEPTEAALFKQISKYIE